MDIAPIKGPKSHIYSPIFLHIMLLALKKEDCLSITLTIKDSNFKFFRTHCLLLIFNTSFNIFWYQSYNCLNNESYF